MYKPTTYLTVEVDPAHSSSEGVSALTRLFGFVDPLTYVTAKELGLTMRLKCKNRPYWNMGEAAQNSIWAEIVAPYLRSKLSIVEEVLRQCNNKKYAHYEGALHLVWLKLYMEPFEIRFFLDHDAEDVDYLPETFALLERVRAAVNTVEFGSFENGADGIAVCIPDRDAIRARKALRAQEASQLAAWQAAQRTRDDAESVSEGTELMEGECATKPEMAAGLACETLEFIRPDGASIIYDIAAKTWAS